MWLGFQDQANRPHELKQRSGKLWSISSEHPSEALELDLLSKIFCAALAKRGLLAELSLLIVTVAAPKGIIQVKGDAGPFGRRFEP